MPRKSGVPKYCLHKASGLAYMRIKGRVHYLGRYDSPESRTAYSRKIQEIDRTPAPDISSLQDLEGLTVVEICAAYLDHCEIYYRKNGKSTHHINAIKLSLQRLADIYGETPAAEFGPRALKGLRQTMIEKHLSRSYINDQVEIIKRMFCWAVSEELLPASIDHALKTVKGLQKGRSEARETDPVGPVPDQVVDATLDYLPAVIADMVRIQRLTASRPGEICQLRPGDVDRRGEVWEYRPATHKTEHHGKERTIYIGPKAQAILLPYLLRPSNVYCFSPAESENRRQAERRAKRLTSVQPSQKNRRRPAPKRRPADRYNKDNYRRAIARAVHKANKRIRENAEREGIEDPQFLKCWHPNQLRHTAATEIRRQFGIEGAQLILGHSRADVTQIYAERDTPRAIEIAKRIG